MEQLSTPSYNLKNYPEVYDPSEDSFLLLDTLEKEIPFLRELQPNLAVEIGSGSGIVITALSMTLGGKCCCFATDINPQACLATVNTGVLNNININCLNMDLLSSFKHNLFDLILFNPPYVVTESNEIVSNGLSRAWAGGRNGREIIDQLINNLGCLLSKRGVCYLLLLKENNINDIQNILQEHKLCSNLVMERRILGEHLYVIKIFRYQ